MLSLLFIFGCVVVLAYCLSLFAPMLGLLAYPGEHRQHNTPTPMVGGVAIFIGISLGVVLFSKNYQAILPSMMLLCMVGLIDDRYKLPSLLRILLQGIAAYLMIEFTGVKLTSLGSILSQNEFQLESWSIPVTVFATIGVINALNMSDGLDGLAGLITIFVLLSLLLFSPELYSFISITIAAISGFLFWNLRLFRQRATLFMGDAGSTVLGLIIAFLLIQSSQQPFNSIQPITALWLLALPLFDTVAVMLIRPLRGKSPFSADRIHYHHLIQNQGFSVNSTIMIILALQSLLASCGLLMLVFNLGEGFQMIAYLACFSMYLILVLIKSKSE